MKLKDKVAVVTGGASGFGRAICELYAKEGAKVVVADLNGQGARDVAMGIGSSAAHVAADVSKRPDVDAMIGEAVKAFGGVDIMVNNAGYAHKRQSMLDVTEADFDRILAVNVKAIYLAALACVPIMEKRGGGAIINTASTAGVRPRPGLTWYNGSKGAAITLTKSMAAELCNQSSDRRDRHAGAVHGHAGYAGQSRPVSGHHSARPLLHAGRHRQRCAVPRFAGEQHDHRRGTGGGRRPLRVRCG
jgi:NAD(P)-dependent dehydrogenase (short-subunit alcohol dehydrogenase family)